MPVPTINNYLEIRENEALGREWRVGNGEAEGQSNPCERQKCGAKSTLLIPVLRGVDCMIR